VETTIKDLTFIFSVETADGSSLDLDVTTEPVEGLEDTPGALGRQAARRGAVHVARSGSLLWKGWI